ncbi:MAG: enoyl-CoA hydratase/isomerase family protein, partial [Gemmatimonadales bacterium]
MAEGAFSTVAVNFDGPVGTVTLNRPDKLNAFTVEMADELKDALIMVAGSASVRCIVLTGAGRAFCAGADVGLLKEIQEKKDVATGRRIVEGSRAVHKILREADQPVLCALNGVAAGGGANLALGCDLRIAANTASIGQVFHKIGLHPDWGATYFLPRMIGTARAMELFLSADLVAAPRLLELGLVNRVVPAAQLASQAQAWAQQIAAAPPVAVRLMKRNVYRSERSTLDEMLDAELEAQLACFATADCAEGLAAFFAKRSPQFTGR